MGILIDILKEIPISAVLRSKLEEQEKKYEALEAENTKLKEENQKLQSKVNELTISDELCEDEVKILKFLSSSSQEFTAEMIARSLGLNPTKTEYYLEKMWSKYVGTAEYVGRPPEYYLAQQGRQYLVENDLVE